MRDGPVAVVSSNYWPEATGISQTTTEFAEHLAASGFEVRVATAMPYYPAWEIFPAYRGRLVLTEARAGVTIRRAWHHVSPRVSTLTRLLHEATLALCSLPNLWRVIRGARRAFIVSPDLSFAWLACRIAKLCGVPITLQVKDVMPDAAIELGMLKSRFAIGLSEFLARQCYTLADEIHTLGEGMGRRVARLAPPSAVIRIIPDTIDGDELAPVAAAENEFRRRFVPEGVCAVMHTGNMGRKQDLGLLLDAAERLLDEPAVQFHVFGDGAEKQAFLAARDARRLTNVHHHPLQERWMLRHMLSGADLVLVSQRGEVVDIVVPSKLLTSLAAGAMVCVAAAEDSEAARLVRGCGGGVVIPASDADALVKVIRQVRGGTIDTAACRAAGRAHALATFGRAAVFGRLVDELRGAPARDPEDALA